jgi:hypothetical protein
MGELVLFSTLIFSICIALCLVLFMRSSGIAAGSWGQVETIFMFAANLKGFDNEQENIRGCGPPGGDKGGGCGFRNKHGLGL